MIVEKWEEKLEQFTATVMREAAEKRKKIYEQIENERKQLLEQNELEVLEQAYIQIQNSIRDILKEKNEKISKVLLDNKRRLLQKREQIVEEVFQSITDKVKNFVQSPDYYDFLINNIIEGCNTVGSGDLVIYINKSDLPLKEKIAEQIRLKLGNDNFSIEEEKHDMIGGAKIFNKTKNLFINNSLSEKIQYEKEHFLETSGLIIN